MAQTSWQQFTLSNVLETLRFAPMNLKISASPILHYTLPQALSAGEIINYHFQYGFKSIKWTGIISSVNDNKITVRLSEGPFRGFNASHKFVSEGNLTACYDELSFQGLLSISEEAFANCIDKSSIVYGIEARKNTRDVIQAYENEKKTQAFEALDQSATAG